MTTPISSGPRSSAARPGDAGLDPSGIAGRCVYMIGIGGCGMSGLARMLRARGAIVSGSDSTPQESTGALIAEGVPVGFDQAHAGLPDDCALVVASAAIKPDHPQMLDAVRRGVPTLIYAEALGRCMIGRTGVAVAGTHGKSTTTAMLGTILVDAGLDPTVIVGATCPQLVSGALGGPFLGSPPLRGGALSDEGRASESLATETPPRRGGLPKSRPPTSGPPNPDRSAGFRLGAEAIPAGALARRPGLLIAEACEFNRSFHNFRPVLASISSVEADHLDVYGTLDAVVEAFHQFAGLVAPADEGGRLLIAHEGAHRREVTAGVRCAVETIGFSPEADWTVTFDPSAGLVGVRNSARRIDARWTTRLPGQHNAMNAATACALALMLGAPLASLEASLAAFAGVDRRTQFLGERSLPGGGRVIVYDDYGHHPTEVDATLRALKQAVTPSQREGEGGWVRSPRGSGAEHPPESKTDAERRSTQSQSASTQHPPRGRLICVFQPHQHSRTRHLLDEFAAAFSSADIVIVPEIYFVRDSIAEKHKVSAADLVDRLRQRGVRAMHLHPFEAIVEQLENVCRGGDTLVVMGAGPVWQVARAFLAAG